MRPHEFEAAFGMPMQEVLRVTGMMRERGLKTAKQLELALLPERLEVVDAGNPKRVLGTMDARGVPLHQQFVRTHVLGELSPVAPSRVYPVDMRMDTAEFEVAYTPTAGGRIKTAQLRTYTSLQMLMRMREFRLDGETPRAAKERFYRAAYGG